MRFGEVKTYRGLFNRLGFEDPRTIITNGFLDISAISERIFFKPKAFFFIYYLSASIFIVVFVLHRKVLVNLKCPLTHY